ncbi:Myosin heavy chain, cardiac muscle isoform [Myotis brandtii]|uniref:Myosin heavy chain, cardiac muscle isoform n=1 Tax=Myotis brandtii TaxID=109478 RepID=S7NWB6_MYOBR|nr:Myosin heavy chain, cardiac muscle isoform [Myotis brandtii]
MLKSSAELLIKSKIQLEARVKALSARVEEEAEINSELTARGRKLEDECSEFKKEIDDLETILVKSQKEKCATEHKVVQEARQQTLDDLYTEQEKLSNLSKANLKLKQQVDEFEGALEQERKAKMNVKGKSANWRAISSCTRRVWHRESSQLELTEKLRKKELEMSQMNSKVEHEKDLVAQPQQMVKELQVVIYQTPVNSHTAFERTTQAKVERDRADLTQELEDLNGRLGQAGGDSLASGRKLRDRKRNYRSFVGIWKRPRCTLRQLLKLRHADILTDRKSQIEDLQQIKQKLEKDKSDLQLNVDDHLTHVEQMTELRGQMLNEGAALWWSVSSHMEELCSATSQADGCQYSGGGGSLSCLLSSAKDVRLQLSQPSVTVTFRESNMKNKRPRLSCSGLSPKAMLKWRMKYEDDAIHRTEDLEDAKNKLAIRLQEAAGTRGVANARNDSLERTRHRLQLDLVDALWDLGKACSTAAVLDQKQQHFDMCLDGWRHTCEKSTVSQETLQGENYSLQGLSRAWSQSRSKDLWGSPGFKEEISNLTNQLREENKKLSEMEKGALKCNESKNLCFQLELSDTKAELERRLSEKDEEIENFSLDSATRSRIEATRLKRNMEGDLNETELQLSCANRRVSEATTSLGQLQIEIKDLWMHLDDSTHLNSELKEQVAMAQQRNSLFQSQLEELRSFVDNAPNTTLLGQKKKLEVDVARMQKEAREAMWRCRNAEEKAKKTAAVVANMSEELKKDQDANAHLEKMRSNMEQTIKDLQKRLDEAEQMALMGSRKQIQKLESRAEEGKKYLSRMQTLMDNLQLNVQSYKQQIEAVEAQANQYLSKYKKRQCELNEAKERAEIAESQVNKLKIKAKEFGKKCLEDRRRPHPLPLLLVTICMVIGPSSHCHGLAPPAHLLHHPTTVLLSSGPIRASSASTAAHCQCRIANACHVSRHPLVGELCLATSQAEGYQYSSGGGSLSCLLSSAKDV